MTIQPGWGEQWNILSTAINEYYGGGIESAQYQQVVNMLNSGNYTMQEMESILGNIPEFNRTYNAAGELTSVSYNVSKSASSTAGNVAQEINSNVASASNTQFSNVQTITKNPQTGTVTIGDDVIKYKTGQLAPTTMKAVAGSALAALCATGVGISLGKTIDSTLYNLNPDFWDDHNMQGLNPETWGDITAGDDSLGARLFNMVFGIDETTGNPQAYISEDAFAYMTAYMGSQGALGGGNEASIDNIPYLPPSIDEDQILMPIPVARNATYCHLPVEYAINELSSSGNGYFCQIKLARDSTSATIFYISQTRDTITQEIYSREGDYIETQQYNTTSISYNGLTYYYFKTRHFSPIPQTANHYTSFGNRYGVISSDIGRDDDIAWTAGYIIFNGSITGGVDGITDQPQGIPFDGTGITNWSNIPSVLQELQNQYPGLWENRLEISPNGDTTYVYLPIGFPTGGNGIQPTTNGASQLATEPDIAGKGANATDELIKTLIDVLTHPSEGTGMDGDTDTPVKPVDPNADPRGTGENPPIIPPIGSASALWKIYNPSQGQLDTFGAWLWSSNFVDQLLKLFNDPMQAIIGLHKVFCNPPISGSGPIKVGYLVSDASANYVSNQYTEIDCGDVDLKEKFGNVFDYDGFTRISVFLPFIGFRDLDTKDVMRGKMNIKYGIDVLTGACLAKIKITRDLNSPILYTFEGNCAVQYPVSSGSYIGIVTGALGIAGSIAGTIATGGAMTPALLRAGAAIPNMHANIQHSGNISSNVGALGPKKPYIVIQRPQTQMPQSGILIEGEGHNESVMLGSLSGFVRVKKGDYNGIPGTSNELNEIRELLENGIYMA